MERWTKRETDNTKQIQREREREREAQVSREEAHTHTHTHTHVLPADCIASGTAGALCSGTAAIKMKRLQFERESGVGGVGVQVGSECMCSSQMLKVT